MTITPTGPSGTTVQGILYVDDYEDSVPLKCPRLGAAAFAPAVNQPVVVTYTDGWTSASTQSFSDWGAPAGYAGETIVNNMSTRIGPNVRRTPGPFMCAVIVFR